MNASHILKLAKENRQSLLTELQQAHKDTVHDHLAISRVYIGPEDTKRLSELGHFRKLASN